MATERGSLAASTVPTESEAAGREVKLEQDYEHGREAVRQCRDQCHVDDGPIPATPHRIEQVEIQI